MGACLGMEIGRRAIPDLGALSPLVASLSEEKSSRVMQLAEEVSFGRGQELLRAGEHWRHLWVVKAGVVRLFYLGESGQEFTKNFFLEGQVLWPLTDTLRNEPSNFFVAALEDVVVYAWPMEELEALVGQEPAWQEFRCRALQLLLDEKMWRERLLLFMSAEDRYSCLQAQRPSWCARLPLRHQASWIGVTDVTLSRVRRRMGVGRN